MQLVGDRDAEGEGVRPAQRERRRAVDKDARPLYECRRERIHDGHFTDGVADGPDHGARQEVADEDAGRAATGQRRTAAQPQAHTDGRTECDHGQVASAEEPSELGVGAMVVVAPREGVAGDGLAEGMLFGREGLV